MNSPRRLAAIWAAIGLAAIAVGVALAINRGDSSPRRAGNLAEKLIALSQVTEEQTAQGAHYIAKIPKLHLDCQVQYVCHLMPIRAGSLPLFVAGMDVHMMSYLEGQGYTDLWTASKPVSESWRTIGHGDGYELGSRQFVYKPPSGPVTGLRTPLSFLTVANRTNGRWPVTVTWTLTAPSGQIVRSLSYNLEIIECSERESYCENVVQYLYTLPKTGNGSKGVYPWPE